MYSTFMPPFSAMKRCPASVKSTTSTVPALPPMLSLEFRATCSIFEPGKSDT